MVAKKTQRNKAAKRKHKKTQRRKHKKKTPNFKQLNCAPNKNRAIKQSCYSNKSLLKIRDLWNARHPDKSIESDEPLEVWKLLKKYMGSCCSNEADWLKHNFIKHNLDDELVNYTFAPATPKDWNSDPYQWLSSLDINNVMKQYEKTYPMFEFIGPSPIDFDDHLIGGDCVWEELCKFNLKHYIDKGITKIGIVFNLDPHYKEGSHWFAVFLDIEHNTFYYFDSYGVEMEPQIKKLVKNLKEQFKRNGRKLKVVENTKRFQYSDGECGIYCIYFILHMLKTKKFNGFHKLNMNDSKMKSYRKKYFNYDL